MAASSAHAQVINPSLFQSLPHDDYGPRVNLTVWTLGSMALAWLGLRIFCKWLRQRRLWWDDYVLVASWVSTYIHTYAVVARADPFRKRLPSAHTERS